MAKTSQEAQLEYFGSLGCSKTLRPARSEPLGLENIAPSALGATGALENTAPSRWDPLVRSKTLRPARSEPLGRFEKTRSDAWKKLFGETV